MGVRKTVVLAVLVSLWWTTNGWNGIAMQSMRREENVLAVTLLVTHLQLLCGGVLGGCLLASRGGLWVAIRLDRSRCQLAFLHLIGSTMTNLGFMFGSASLVQIVKLLEPLETLAWRQFLFREQKPPSRGVIGSMVVVVGASMTLVRSRGPDTSYVSILCALLSGLTLSARNVCQREKVSANGSAWEESLAQFTQLSLHCSLFTFPISLVLVFGTDTSEAMTWQALLWHPLYNLFSMLTLGFCGSSLTHSLLNVGKRVVAILAAMLWFGEPVSLGTSVGLIVVSMGALWYAYESKRRTSGTSVASLYGAIVLLSIAVGAQTMESQLRLMTDMVGRELSTIPISAADWLSEGPRSGGTS